MDHAVGMIQKGRHDVIEGYAPQAVSIVVRLNRGTGSGTTGSMGWSYSHESVVIGTAVVERIRAG